MYVVACVCDRMVENYKCEMSGRSSHLPSPPEPATATILHVKGPPDHKVSLGATVFWKATHLDTNIKVFKNQVMNLSVESLSLLTSGGASGSS